MSGVGALIGWGLAVVAVAAGYALYGWPGVALAFTIIVFWLLLQFSRALRAMRAAAARPVGTVASAVMLQSKLQKGMRLMAVIQLTRSLGLKAGDNPEAWRWADEGGATVTVSFVDGRCTSWELVRADLAATPPSPPTPP
jgi:uncharacterized protein (DUF58 family)